MDGILAHIVPVVMCSQLSQLAQRVVRMRGYWILDLRRRIMAGRDSDEPRIRIKVDSYQLATYSPD